MILRLPSARCRGARIARRTFSNDKSLEDLVRNKTAAAVAANQPPPQRADAPKTAIVPPDVAHDLCHEVGWESRHSFVDVRGTEAFARGRPKGAINAPHADGTLDGDIPAEPGRLVVGGGSQKSVAAAADVLRARGFDVMRWRGASRPAGAWGCRWTSTASWTTRRTMTGTRRRGTPSVVGCDGGFYGT